MARGWESKSVEEQQAEAVSSRASAKPRRTGEQIGREREQQNLQMSCNYLRQQLEKASDPRHRRMLEAALADLQAKIERLAHPKD